MSEHLQIACEMLGLGTIRLDGGERYDESLLDDKLRSMLDRWSMLARRVTSDLYTRQSIATVIVAWEATKPEALCDAVNNDLFRYRKGLSPLDHIGPGLRSEEYKQNMRDAGAGIR